MHARQTGRVDLVHLVCFVCLVDLAHLIGFVQPKTRQTRQTRQTKQRSSYAGGLFQHPAIAVHGRRKYHPLHATHLDAYRLARGALPHRSQYHPAHTGWHGGRPNRMDALSPRISSRACRTCTDRMDLDRHGLRHLWNGGFGLRPCHSHKHPGRTRRSRRPVLLQCDERDRELFTNPVRRPRVFSFVPGIRASNIPPSQSSVPFFIRKTLIRSNPASVSQALVSSAL